MVRFANGRSVGKRRPPMHIRGFRDKYGRSIDFREIPLYTESGEPDMIPGKNGTPAVQRTWGQEVKFGPKHVIALHPVIHKDVIEAIRSLPFTVSSKKANSPARGKIIEVEPDVQLERRLKTSETKLEALSKLRDIKDDVLMLYLAGASFGIIANSRKEQIAVLTDKVSESPAPFLEIFDSSGDVKSEIRELSLLKIARTFRVLTTKNGIWYFGEERLGSQFAKINSEYPEIMGELEEKVADYITKL